MGLALRGIVREREIQRQNCVLRSQNLADLSLSLQVSTAGAVIQPVDQFYRLAPGSRWGISWSFPLFSALSIPGGVAARGHGVTVVAVRFVAGGPLGDFAPYLRRCNHANRADDHCCASCHSRIFGVHDRRSILDCLTINGFQRFRQMIWPGERRACHCLPFVAGFGSLFQIGASVSGGRHPWADALRRRRLSARTVRVNLDGRSLSGSALCCSHLLI